MGSYFHCKFPMMMGFYKLWIRLTWIRVLTGQLVPYFSQSCWMCCSMISKVYAQDSISYMICGRFWELYFSGEIDYITHRADMPSVRFLNTRTRLHTHTSNWLRLFFRFPRRWNNAACLYITHFELSFRFVATATAFVQMLLRHCCGSVAPRRYESAVPKHDLTWFEPWFCFVATAASCVQKLLRHCCRFVAPRNCQHTVPKHCFLIDLTFHFALLRRRQRVCRRCC